MTAAQGDALRGREVQRPTGPDDGPLGAGAHSVARSGLADALVD
jgi:hypothetical protein